MNFRILLRKVRVALTPRDRILRARLDNGAVVHGKNRKAFGGRGAYIFRDDLEPELRHLTKFLPSDGVLVDLGANTGVFSQKAAKHVQQGGGAVLSVEPFLDVAAMLFYSVQRNRFDHVRVRNFAAGAKTGVATLWRNFGKPNSFSLIQRDPGATGITTLVVALDDLFRWEGLTRLDYLKMDVEGVESQVLEGAAATITKYRPIIQAEVNIHDTSVPFPNYTTYQAPDSNNKVFIPNESRHNTTALGLGWAVVE